MYLVLSIFISHDMVVQVKDKEHIPIDVKDYMTNLKI
jgi:hypothetical protein